jgi:rfaE bifunctional protein nucleotidyltransferase chain/domain
MKISRELAANILSEARDAGKKAVFTNGCFDIIHAGHVTYLAQAKRLGDILIVGLNSDESVSRLKGPSRPVNNYADRAAVMSALKPVDYVVEFTEDTPLELIKAIKPDIITKGGDYTPENIVGADFVTANGGEVVVIPFVPGKSTTGIISRMKK